MNDLAIKIESMTPSAIDLVRQLEIEVLKLPQVEIATQHAFHAGMYARTLMVPAGVVLTGALMKIPTILILSGDAVVYTDKGAVRMTGYNVLLGSAGRKQACMALTDTYATMLFPSNAKTMDEAEAEFTDEVDKLFSRKDGAKNSFAVED